MEYDGWPFYNNVYVTGRRGLELAGQRKTGDDNVLLSETPYSDS